MQERGIDTREPRNRLRRFLTYAAFGVAVGTLTIITTNNTIELYQKMTSDPAYIDRQYALCEQNMDAVEMFINGESLSLSDDVTLENCINFLNEAEAIGADVPEGLQEDIEIIDRILDEYRSRQTPTILGALTIKSSVT